MKPDFSLIGQIMALGVSPFVMSATESAITIVMNHGPSISVVSVWWMIH